jgi:hypothetical protein
MEHNVQNSNLINHFMSLLNTRVMNSDLTFLFLANLQNFDGNNERIRGVAIVHSAVKNVHGSVVRTAREERQLRMKTHGRNTCFSARVNNKSESDVKKTHLLCDISASCTACFLDPDQTIPHDGRNFQ